MHASFHALDHHPAQAQTRINEQCMHTSVHRIMPVRTVSDFA